MSLTKTIDPRLKLFYLFSLIILIFLSKSLIHLLSCELLILVVIIDQGIVKKWLKFSVSVSILLILIIGVNYWLIVPGDENTAFIAALRIFCYFSVMFWFSSSVEPDTLAQILTALKIPYAFSWQLSTAYRFIPLLELETKKVVEAQVSRGIPLDRGFVTRIKSTIKLIIPLLASTLTKSDQLAEALIVRGWNPKIKRTELYPLKMRPIEYCIFIVLCISLSLGVSWLIN